MPEELSMTLRIQAKMFAMGHTALMICALTLSLAALPSTHPALKPVTISNALTFSSAFPHTVPSAQATFLVPHTT